MVIILKNKILNFLKFNYKYIILSFFTFLLITIKLPYVIYIPGGTIDLTDRVIVSNNNNLSGSFNMAYVSMLDGHVLLILLSYIMPNWDLVKSADIVYEDESVEEMLETDKIFYEESINSAIVIAYQEANANIIINGLKNEIVFISSYAETDLKLGDILIQADNINIEDLDKYKDVIESHVVGDEINLIVLRNNKETTANIMVKNIDGEKKTGIAVVSLYDFSADPKIEVKMVESESGPSGGLMIALDIYDKLTDFDLSRTRRIAGTGTIDNEGNVGEIGGIKYKILGAINDEVDVFLCPSANYEEAKVILDKESSTMKLISVNSLKEAIEALS